MVELKSGDVVFSYFRQSIVAVSTVITSANPRAQPAEFDTGDAWARQGLMADVAYRDIVPPLKVSEVLPNLQPLLPHRRSPLNQHGTGNQGYLFGLPGEAGALILDHIAALSGDPDSEPIVQAIVGSVKDITEKESLVRSRLGQGQFRTTVLAMFNDRCCVTGLSETRLLRASHIKPWRDSNNEERLDEFNGLLLAPHHDAVFDLGYTSFDSDGRIKLSPSVPATVFTTLGISVFEVIRDLRSEHLPYLEYHRNVVFRD